MSLPSHFPNLLSSNYPKSAQPIYTNGTHKYVIRVDDYPTGVRAKLPNYRGLAAQVLGHLERYDIPYMLAVVPAQLEPEDAEFLRRRKNMTVAMHGYNHDQGHAGFRRVTSEFTGNSVERNVDLLERGRKLLDTLDTLDTMDTCAFVPPGNAYDLNLLKALARTGFKLCFGTFPKVWHAASPVTILHAFPPLYGHASDVLAYLSTENGGGQRRRNGVVSTARRYYYRSAISLWERLFQFSQDVDLSPELLQIALHWTWEWDDINSNESQLSELCAWLSNQEVIGVPDLLMGHSDS